MTYSWPALPAYLYGLTHEAERDDVGKLIITASRIETHEWGGKVVPSGFFSLPGSENVSAVAFNSGGTIAKFNRMGVSAGFGEKDVVLIRRGSAWNPDPDASTPISFIHIVSEGYPETWIEGMDVYHNPNAVRPLNPDLLPGAAHHRVLPNGQIETTSAGWKPMESMTSIVTFSSHMEEILTIDDATAEAVPDHGDQSAPSVE